MFQMPRPTEPERAAPPSRDSTRTPTPVRTDIQALRAIAVGLVLLNHLWPWHVPGGYIGVDIFFVISGFLITSHLLREHDRRGTISLPRFYARRAKRLLPAALLVALVSLAAAIVWVPAERWERIAREVFAASAYFENWMLTLTSVDYSAQSEAATPVQHYWSLSVEEQFYLVWPALILLVGWLAARRAHGAVRPALLATTAVLGVGSFVFCLWLTGTDSAVAYFHTGVRGWEFLAGGLLAFAGTGLERALGRPGGLAARGFAHWIGLAALAFAALRFTAETPFPGAWALVPVGATVLLIATGAEAPAWSPLRWMAWRPVQYVGDVSYSLYLWHWPLIVILPFVLHRDLGTLARIGVLALSLVLAAATKHFVEDPGRARLFSVSRPRVPLLAALASVLVVGAAAIGVIGGASALQQRAAAEERNLASSDCFGAGALAPGAEQRCGDPFGPAKVPPGGERNTPWFSPSECVLAPSDRQIIADGKPSLVECAFGAAAGGTAPPPVPAPGSGAGPKPASNDVWLVGDSHAEHWKGAVFDLARGNDWSLRSTMHGGCPFVDAPFVSFKGAPTKKADSCAAWNADVRERLLAAPPALLLVSVWGSAETLDDGTGRPQPQQYADGIRPLFTELARAGTEIVVIRDIPNDGPRLGIDCVTANGDRAGGCTAPVRDALKPDPLAKAAEGLRLPDAHVLDLTPRFCAPVPGPAGGGSPREPLCSGVIGGVPVFYDRDHLSRSYSKSLAEPLGRELGRALQQPVRPPKPER